MHISFCMFFIFWHILFIFLIAIFGIFFEFHIYTHKHILHISDILHIFANQHCYKQFTAGAGMPAAPAVASSAGGGGRESNLPTVEL